MRNLWTILITKICNYLDAHRQAEINRLVIRAGRRCYRDMRHMYDDLPEHSQEHYKHRIDMWQEVFWDSSGYRDSLHLTIHNLEMDNAKLEKQLRDNGITPDTDLPF